VRAANSTWVNAAGQMRTVAACLDTAAVDAYMGVHCCSDASGSASDDSYWRTSPLCSSSSSSSSISSACPTDGRGQHLLPASAHFDRLADIATATASASPSHCSPSAWPADAAGYADLTPSNSTDTSNNTTSTNTSAAYPVFQCGALPACSNTCSGPDQGLVAAAAAACACTTEWYLHSQVQRGLATAAVLLLLNAARLLLCAGLRMLLHRELGVPVLAVQLTCTADGRLLDERACALELRAGRPAVSVSGSASESAPVSVASEADSAAAAAAVGHTSQSKHKHAETVAEAGVYTPASVEGKRKGTNLPAAAAAASRTHSAVGGLLACVGLLLALACWLSLPHMGADLAYQPGRQQL